MLGLDIDYSKFTLKCGGNGYNDCGQNEKRRCCVSCDKYKKCRKNGWTCSNLEELDNDPQECTALYLKIER